MVEEGGGGGENLAMASSSTGNNTLPSKEVPPDWRPYPPPFATYEDVVASPKLFMDTLQKLHAVLGTKFMIPIVGGKDLDLHRLFVEVTSRGGIGKILKERRWKDVTAVFSFPSSATNASFILRKYYCSLLLHYEQIYFFKAKGWSPSACDSFEHAPTVTAPPHGSVDLVQSSLEIQAAVPQKQRMNAAESQPEVHGVIDGKFESGYLITVKIGSEEFKGVLYQASPNPAQQVSHGGLEYRSSFVNSAGNPPGAPGVHRRKRRKKSEIKKRDPAHPKPNRSGYNFFFAEQHARLKPLYPGKDREISRMIGELWSNLKEPEKAVYQEKAMRDKERYKLEMEDYKERLRTGNIVSDAVPIQQQPLWPDITVMDADDKLQSEAAESPHTAENETSSEKSEKSYLEDTGTADKELDIGETHEAENVLTNMTMEISSNEEASELQKRLDKIGDVARDHRDDNAMEQNEETLSNEKQNAASVEHESSVTREERELLPDIANESLPSH